MKRIIILKTILFFALVLNIRLRFADGGVIFPSYDFVDKGVVDDHSSEYNNDETDLGFRFRSLDDVNKNKHLLKVHPKRKLTVYPAEATFKSSSVGQGDIDIADPRIYNARLTPIKPKRRFLRRLSSWRRKISQALGVTKDEIKAAWESCAGRRRRERKVCTEKILRENGNKVSNKNYFGHGAELGIFKALLRHGRQLAQGIDVTGFICDSIYHKARRSPKCYSREGQPICNDKKCPCPCGCHMRYMPTVDPLTNFAVWGSKKNPSWKQILHVLARWKIPPGLLQKFHSLLEHQYGTHGDEYQLQSFPSKRKKMNNNKWGKAGFFQVDSEMHTILAKRDVDGNVEIGYLYTKATGHVSPHFSCGVEKIETAKGGTIKKPWCTQKALSPAIIMKANRVMQYYGIKYAFERNPHVPRFKRGQQPWFAEEIKSQHCKSS